MRLFLLLTISTTALAATKDAPAVSVTTDETVQTYLVNEINQIRRTVQASNMLKMSWDPDARVIAQRFADKCEPNFPQNEYLKKAYLSTPKYKCGANIGRGSGKVDWGDILQLWYNTSEKFDYGKETGKSGYGFYTAKSFRDGPTLETFAPQARASGTCVPLGSRQVTFEEMVWAKSYSFGCGFKKCDKNDGKPFSFFVCNFCPAGNLLPSKLTPYEKGKPCAKCTKSCDKGLCTNPCPYTNFYGNCDSLFPKGCLANQTKDASAINLQEKCAATCRCREQGLLY